VIRLLRVQGSTPTKVERTINGWETLPLAVVAQRVQVSAFPDAYAKHEPLATAIVNAITDGALTCTASRPASASG
jgi:hypothetical protein